MMTPGRYELRNPKTALRYVLYVREDDSAYLAVNDGRVPSGQEIHWSTALDLLGTFIHEGGLPCAKST